MARVNYDLQLKELKNQMLLLGSMIEEVIRKTIHALITQDVQEAKQIASGDEKIDAQVRKIEQLGYTILLRQQPIANDLRAVSAAMKRITEMERIGDHGADSAELTVLMSKESYPNEIELVKQMSKETSMMLIQAVDAFADGNMQKASAVIARDDIVDDVFLQVKNSLANSIKENDTDAMQELDLLMVAKYFERIGDHATNIAEWVIFSINGELPADD